MGLYSARHHILLFTATATTVFLPCGPVAAQEAASSARDETQGSQNVFGDDIVVTATRREQSVNRVGISITALDGGQLEDLRINEPEKLALVTPGVTIAKAAGSAVSVVTIRGSGNSDFAAHWAGQGAPRVRTMPAAELVAVLRHELAAATAP